MGSAVCYVICSGYSVLRVRLFYVLWILVFCSRIKALRTNLCYVVRMCYVVRLLGLGFSSVLRHMLQT